MAVLLCSAIVFTLLCLVSVQSDDYDGYLFLSSFTTTYKMPVVNSKVILASTVNLHTPFLAPVVDCVTGNIYYHFYKDHSIKQTTKNATNTTTIAYIGEERGVGDMTVDWIKRQLYWVEVWKDGTTLRRFDIDTGKIETNTPPVPFGSRALEVHPTLRKLYVLTQDYKLNSVDLDSSTHKTALFHKEVEVQNIILCMEIDWKTNELCWSAGVQGFSTLKCKNLVNGTIRTVVSEVRPYITGPFTISPHYYYWSVGRIIHALSRSSSRREKFMHSDFMFDINYSPEKCPTLTPAPTVSKTDQS